MTKISHTPEMKPDKLDVLSDLEETIMSGEVSVKFFQAYDTFKKLGGTPTKAMLQRVSEALDKLEEQQNVPAPPESTPQSDADAIPTIALCKPRTSEQSPVPSASTLGSAENVIWVFG